MRPTARSAERRTCSVDSSTGDDREVSRAVADPVADRSSVGEIDAVEQDCAGVRGLDAGSDAQQCRPAGAAFTPDGGELASFDRERSVPHRDRAAAIVVPLGDVLDAQECHLCPSFRRTPADVAHATPA